ncbi:unnamed protein product, partial [Bubo scandiacus]
MWRQLLRDTETSVSGPQGKKERKKKKRDRERERQGRTRRRRGGRRWGKTCSHCQARHQPWPRLREPLAQLAPGRAARCCARAVGRRWTAAGQRLFLGAPRAAAGHRQPQPGPQPHRQHPARLPGLLRPAARSRPAQQLAGGAAGRALPGRPAAWPTSTSATTTSALWRPTCSWRPAGCCVSTSATTPACGGCTLRPSVGWRSCGSWISATGGCRPSAWMPWRGCRGWWACAWGATPGCAAAPWSPSSSGCGDASSAAPRIRSWPSAGPPPEVAGAPLLSLTRGELPGLPPHPDAGRLSLHRLRWLRRLHRLGGHQLPAGHHRQLLPPLEQGQRGRGRL